MMAGLKAPMPERREFRLSNEDIEKLQEASRPVPMIMLQCGMPSSPQERANRAWAALGAKYGFLWETVQPVEGKDIGTFTADVKVDA
jgi:hypothetical protein